MNNVQYRVQIDVYNDSSTKVEERVDPRLDFSKIFVFTESDLQRDLRDAQRAYQLVEHLRITLHNGFLSAKSRAALMAEADVTAALARAEP